MDIEYDPKVARIDEVIAESEARVARQRAHIKRMKLAGEPVEDAQRTLDLMLEILGTARIVRLQYVKIFRGYLH